MYVSGGDGGGGGGAPVSGSDWSPSRTSASIGCTCRSPRAETCEPSTSVVYPSARLSIPVTGLTRPLRPLRLTMSTGGALQGIVDGALPRDDVYPPPL